MGLTDMSEAMAPRIEKHSQLEQSIKELDSVIGHLRSLVDKITGEGQKIDNIENAKERTPHSLATILDNGPEDIRRKIETMHSVINDLEHILF